MAQIMRLEGKLIKEKVVEEVEENGKLKKKKVIKFLLDIAGCKMPCPDEIANKLITALGIKKAFVQTLNYEFDAYNLSFVQEGGISADVERVLDYGREKFAVCKIGENVVYVKCEDAVSGEVRLLPDVKGLSIIETGHNIRIV